MKIIEYFVPLVLLTISALLLAKGWSSFEQSQTLVAETEPAQGTIVAMKPYLGGRIGKGGSLIYLPKVRFTTSKGQTITFQSHESRRADHFKKGQQVPVRYRPEAPQEAVIATFSHLWALPIIYAVGGLLLLLFGGWFLRRTMRA